MEFQNRTGSVCINVLGLLLRVLVIVQRQLSSLPVEIVSSMMLKFQVCRDVILIQVVLSPALWITTPSSSMQAYGLMLRMLGISCCGVVAKRRRFV